MNNMKIVLYLSEKDTAPKIIDIGEDVLSVYIVGETEKDKMKLMEESSEENKEDI